MTLIEFCGVALRSTTLLKQQEAIDVFCKHAHAMLWNDKKYEAALATEFPSIHSKPTTNYRHERMSVKADRNLAAVCVEDLRTVGLTSR